MQKIIVFTDPNKDVDDLIAIIMLNNMQKANIIKISGIVTVHGNAETTYKRALYTQAISRLIGNNLKVCAGIPEDYDDSLSNIKVNKFFDTVGLNEIINKADKSKIMDNSELYLKKIFEKADYKSLDLLILAQMTDCYNFSKIHPTLFCDKVRSITIMGGIEEKNNKFIPDNSTNNANDFEASTNLYKFIYNNNIPTKFIDRFATMNVPVTLSFYEDLKISNKIIGDFVYKSKQDSIKGLYEGLLNGESLTRQTPEWFYRTFTNIKEKDYEKYKAKGTNPEALNEVLNKVVKLNLYDPLTLIATIDGFKKFFKVESKKSCFELLMPKDHKSIYENFNKWAKIS